MADDKGTAAGGPKSWRAVTSSEAAAPAANHWQSAERDVVPQHLRRAKTKRRFQILVVCSLVVVVAAVFLFELLATRPRTPLIVIAPSDYEVPFQPLSWSHEDVEGLRALDRETLNVRVIDTGWKTKDHGLRQLDAYLKETAAQARRLGSVVVYIRMHSAVDGTGVPCLVPPGASPFNSDSWLPVKDVFERFQRSNVPDSVRKLVIFDCGSVLVDWNQGIVFNTFASRLAEVVSAANVPNLAVLNTNSPFEMAATSAEMRRGVFGHFLELGLSGAADAPSESGNGNRLVSVRELHRYLQTRVNDWSLQNRGYHQHPQLIPSNVDDFDVANVFVARKGKRIVSPARDIAGSATVSAADVGSLWKKFEDSQRLSPFRFDPLRWADFEQRLRWLEFAIESGDAYNRSSHQQFVDLKQRVASIEASIDQNESGRTPSSRWSKFSKRRLLDTSGTTLNTLSLAGLFGATDGDGADRFEVILTQLKNAPSATNLENAIQLLNSDSTFSSLEMTCLLRLWQRYDVTTFWSDSTVLSSAIELHQLSERASVPLDERCLDWIRPTIEAADKLRRAVDDRVLLGGTVPATEMQDAKTLYNRAVTISEGVAHAYAVRDELDRLLPYLGQWLIRPPVEGHAPSIPLVEVKALLLETVRLQKAVDHALSHVPESVTETAAQLPFEIVLTELESKRTRLLGLLDAEYERLIHQTDVQPTTWNDLRHLLTVPVLPAPNEKLALSPSQQRSLLRERLGQLGRKLIERYSTTARESRPSSESKLATSSEAVPITTTTAQMARYLDELLVNVSENLALAVVQRDREQYDEEQEAATPPEAKKSDTKDDIETIAESQGRELRRWVSSISTAARDDDEWQMSSESKSGFQNSFAERLVRAAESVALIHLEDDPIVLRRRSDFQRLLMWHSERVLTDFWGSSLSEQSSYFDVTATNLLKLARSIGKPSSHSLAEADRLGQILKRYRSAAASGLTTISDNLLVTDASDSIVAKVAIYPNPGQENAFPNGVGAVFVQGENGKRRGDAQALSIPWPVGTDPNVKSTQFDIKLDGIDPNLQPVDLKAVASFRGHDYVGDLTVNSIQGVLVDYAPHMARDSQIAVRGRKTRKLSMVFVLDCSNSMGQTLPLETERRQGSRLQIAKLALQSMLDKLAEVETHRVGVICFGHRVGWDLKQAGQLLRQNEYSGPINDQTRPYDDVETILPLGRFNASFAAAVAERLASIKPWGESPLYLAVIQALEQFDADQEESDKCVVVITDGMNNQFNPPANLRKSLFDVAAVWNNHRVPIHIVGLGIAADQADAAQREFGELARTTAGSYVPVQEARALVESLAALQRVAQFRVRGKSNPTDQVVDLGQSIVVETDSRVASEFDVSLGPANEHVVLHGGEAIDLIPTRDGRKLDIAPYEIGQPQFIPLLNDDRSNSQTELVVGVHRPMRRGKRVTFDVSIQHRQRQFVERPEEVWIEIVPVGRPGQPAPPAYFLYDPHYLPKTSVPVLRWTVSDWPTESGQAKIRVWCKNASSKPASTVLVQNAFNADRDPDFTPAAIPGVNARVRVRRTGTVQVSVVERHSDESAGVGSVKVGLKSSVTPNRVRHRFDAANRISTHFFEFSENSDAVINDGEVQLTTRTSAHDGAMRTADAVIVDVAESGDVHD